MELLHQYQLWVSANCSCDGDQKSNLSSEETRGLNSLRKRVREGDIVVLPTDKSGRFAIMSFQTYLEAGAVHTDGDREVGEEELKQNQSRLNGSVSMLLKIMRVGENINHTDRWRESTLSGGQETCPLWLLFKCHKGWSSSKGGAPPTRPVIGGNQGMNSHLSELLSWLLEPLATEMMGKSSEVNSGEDLKSSLDRLNVANQDWVPANKLVGSLGDQPEVDPMEVPGLCDCEDCLEEGGSLTKERSGADMRRGKGNKSERLRAKREELRERRTVGYKRRHDSLKWVSSRDVPNSMVQDRSKPMVVIGSDCVSLFPNLRKVEAADEAADAVMEGNVDWQNINWQEACRYVALGRPEPWCRQSPIARLLPYRKGTRGCRPGMTGAGPKGATTGDEIQWKFPPSRELTVLEKKMVMAEVVRLTVETAFETHVYSFAGRVYRQSEGGPIGLRSTCALARVVMGRWDQKWKEQLTEVNIQTEDDERYVDDARAFMYPIRPGWRWMRGSLWWRADWEREDLMLSDVEITKRAVFGSMQGLTDCLSFTVETQEDFPDGWLPTLDFKIRITKDNIVEYTFFTKPTASDVCLQADTALNQNTLVQSLSNEVARRLDNISNTMSKEERVAVLDDFTRKLGDSGHSIKAVRGFLVNGIKQHIRKKKKCLESGEPFHRAAASSAPMRRKKKLTAKSGWFRQGKKDDSNSSVLFQTPMTKQVKARPVQPAVSEQGATVEIGEGVPGSRGGRRKTPVQTSSKAGSTSPKPTSSKKKPMRTTSVLFTEFSKGGSLQKSLREVVDRLAPMMGFNIRVVERGGTSLGALLSNKNPWSGAHCGRGVCRTCRQPGDRKEDCKSRNIVYESVCTRCNPSNEGKEEAKAGLLRSGEPSLYVGESSRSLHERAREHWADADKGVDECHMMEHEHAAHRGEDGSPAFRFKVVKGCRTALERQVREAVRIQQRGSVLNKRGEFNRCKLTRMDVDVMWEQKCWDQAWAKREDLERDEEADLTSRAKEKRMRAEEGASMKRRKREEGSAVWGESVCSKDQERRAFLENQTGVREGTVQTQIKLLSGSEWMAREMVKEILWEVAECGAALDSARDLIEWEQPAPHIAPGPGRSKQEENVLFKLLEELDKSATASCKKTPGPTKGRRKKTVYKGQPSIIGLFKSSKLKTVRVCVFPRKPAETLPGQEERNLRLRLERQASMQKDWQWRREGLRLGGAVSGWLELELQLTAGTDHLGSVQALSSAQLQSVHTLTSAQLVGSSSTDCTEPVLLESTPVQLSEISTATVGAEKLLKVVEGGDMQEVPDHQQGAEVGGGLEEGGGQGEGGEVRVGDQVKGGDSCSGITAVSIKNQEQGVSFKTSKSAGSVSQRGQLFSSSKGGLCRIGFETTPSKKRRFQQSSTEFQSVVSGFESTSSKPVSVKCGMGSECSSPAKRRRYGKTNLAQCSKSGSGKSVGHVSIFRGDQPVNNQQSSEAEDDQLTQVSELEIENISSTVFIL